jgi:hypothetical protein
VSLRTALGLSRESSLMTGTPDEQRQAWREWRRAKDAQAIKDRWREIPSAQLVASRCWLEDTQTGAFYREFGGDPGYAQSVVAYYLRADGSPVMLEPHDPPCRAEMEKRQAAKEQRRLDAEAARRARYAELRKSAER